MSVFALKQELWLAMARKHQTAIIILTTKWVRWFSATYWILCTHQSHLQSLQMPVLAVFDEYEAFLHFIV